MDETLPGFDPPPEREAMSAGRRTTQKRRELIEKGVHPATGLPTLKDGRTCGGCAHLLKKENPAEFAGTYWKCAIARAASHNDGPDVRKSWPACSSFEGGIMTAPLTEITKLVEAARDFAQGFGIEPALITRLADALEECAPRFITTETELDELPGLSVVMDAHGDVSQKRGGLWCGYETAPLTSHQLAKSGPFTVIYTPPRKEER